MSGDNEVRARSVALAMYPNPCLEPPVASHCRGCKPNHFQLSVIEWRPNGKRPEGSSTFDPQLMQDSLHYRACQPELTPDFRRKEKFCLVEFLNLASIFVGNCDPCGHLVWRGNSFRSSNLPPTLVPE